MNEETLLHKVTEKAQRLLSGNYDEETKQEVEKMLNDEDKSLDRKSVV